MIGVRFVTVHYLLDAIKVETAARWSLEDLMYVKKADDLHRPRSWIFESLIPIPAAVVAAPIRKLWPE